MTWNQLSEGALAVGGRDPYEVLGVSTDATAADITRAFRRGALVEHPDRGGDPEAFRHLHEAREVLLDPARRAEYDLSRRGVPTDRSDRDGFNSGAYTQSYARSGRGPRHRRANPVNRFAFYALLVALFVPSVAAIIAIGTLAHIRYTGARGAWAAWLAIGVSAAGLWWGSAFSTVF